jgi:hypothetical protein
LHHGQELPAVIARAITNFGEPLDIERVKNRPILLRFVSRTGMDFNAISTGFSPVKIPNFALKTTQKSLRNQRSTPFSDFIGVR